MHLEIRDADGEWMRVNTGALVTILMTIAMFLVSIQLTIGVQ